MYAHQLTVKIKMDKISTHIQRLFKCCISENGEKLENSLASDTPVLNPILKLILEAVYDEESNLSTIRGTMPV